MEGSSHSFKPLNDIDPYNIKKVLSIVHYGRAGSYFFASLLDNHPEVITFPSGMIMSYSSFFEEVKGKPANFVIDEFFKVYRGLFDPEHLESHFSLHKMGENQDEILTIDRNHFRDALIHFLSYRIQSFHLEGVPCDLFFRAIHLAFAECIGQRLETRNPVIAFSQHIPAAYFGKFMVGHFEEIQFIHMVRNPIQGWTSWYAVTSKEEKGCHDAFYRMLSKSCEFGGPIFAPCSATSRAIRLEDLKLKPKEVMEALIQWMKISWHDNLLESTFGGKLWNFTSTDKIVSGFDKSIISRKHKEHLTWYDKIRLKTILYHAYKAWGYPIKDIYGTNLMKRLVARSTVFLPFRMQRKVWLKKLKDILARPRGTKSNRKEKSLNQKFRIARRIFYYFLEDHSKCSDYVKKNLSKPRVPQNNYVQLLYDPSKK
ncbi:MAG: hypothetical protein ACI9S8_001534 [Chlamydiales bacterium]|jgi:hypothetical protein